MNEVCDREGKSERKRNRAKDGNTNERRPGTTLRRPGNRPSEI